MTSFICNDSFTYDLRIIILDVPERAREKAIGNNNGLSHVPSKRTEEIKSGTSGCSSFLFPTSNLLFHRPCYTVRNHSPTKIKADSL